MNSYKRFSRSKRSTESTLNNLLEGACAGLIATLPMTLFMVAARNFLPLHEKQPLPPRQITKKVLKKMGLYQRFSTAAITALTLFLHFMFGAFAGSIYGVMENKFPLNNTAKGSLAGVLVWAGSYLGWIPAMDILPPATVHPRRRNLLMIIAHLVWGAALGIFTHILKSERNYIVID